MFLKASSKLDELFKEDINAKLIQTLPENKKKVRTLSILFYKAKVILIPKFSKNSIRKKLQANFTHEHVKIS